MNGLEWNVRLSQAETPELLEKFRASFEGYWEDTQFESYNPERDAARFDEALALSRGTGKPEAPSLSFELRPFPFQEEILQALRAERERHGRHRNLVVAATGTGKTLIAAFDYRRLARGDRPSLLFVAHREEILKQSLGAFRAVLRDQSFGELFVGGESPEVGRHVFASIQSLTAAGVEKLAPEDFEMVIVDEFHRAAAPTYRALLAQLRPRELLGLTATPERTDGDDSVFGWFDGRIAAELRLWEALEKGLLCPFQYFGVHDGVDLSHLSWHRGGYAVGELATLYTGDDRRVELVLRALRDRVLDSARMRGLGFCVSVAHAEYMAARFREAGIPAMALSGETGRPDRAGAVRKLRERAVNVLFTVDLFNEGVDVPEVDTVLFLRPTESATLFLQQLGRGLRLAEGKDCLTVLDFIGRQHARFRFDRRFGALTGTGRGHLARQVQQGFPFLPPGCSIQLDRVASKVVLENLRASLGTRFAGLVEALRGWQREPSLAEFLREMDLTIPDLYRRRGWTWSGLRRAAGFPVPEPGPNEARLGRGIAGLAHLDDREWLGLLRKLLVLPEPPRTGELSVFDQRILSGLCRTLAGGRETLATGPDDTLRELWDHPALRAELLELLALLEDGADHLTIPVRELLPTWDESVPLSVHARYSLDQVLAAFARPHRIREGVLWDEPSRSDVFFVTLQKSEKHYSPTTRYRDYAISPTLFHWESQSMTGAESPTGRRYQNHVAGGSHVLLFVREHRKVDGETQPYVSLGPAHYVSHKGDRPMAITWRLQAEIPPELFQVARVAS
jgi:superfamily II DNA or RNA helicase